MSVRPRSLLLSALLLSCGGRTTTDAAQIACSAAAPACLADPDDPCGRAEAASAICDQTARVWSCPSGTRPHARAADEPATCLPFHDTGSQITSLGGSLVRVPTDDGRCLWIAETVELEDGATRRNVAFELDRALPFGTCPAGAGNSNLESAVTVLGPPDPTLLVQISAAYRLGGQTRVLYRLFREDASAVFGVTLLGGGIGKWDPAVQRIVVGGTNGLGWGTDFDIGDAVLVQGDRAYAWGCPGPPEFLTEGCVLTRFGETGSVELLLEDGAWAPKASAAGGKVVFHSGPWISSVVESSYGFLHVYAVGFGSSLVTHAATDLEGPWTEGSELARCPLPEDDPKAFCAGPVVHEELSDPTRPDERAVTVGIGTTSGVPPHGDAFWTRLVWVRGAP